MVSHERVLQEQRPYLVVVGGDVNSTMAATLAASKLGMRGPHLEAGLRSFDRRKLEEINLLVTDVLADVLWTPSQGAVDNLLAEGIPPARILLGRNIMIDGPEMLPDRIERKRAHAEYGQALDSYAVVTIQRPSNVHAPTVLRELCGILKRVTASIPLIFPGGPADPTEDRGERYPERSSGRTQVVPSGAPGKQGFHEPGAQRMSRDHRLGRNQGRDYLSRDSLPDV